MEGALAESTWTAVDWLIWTYFVFGGGMVVVYALVKLFFIKTLGLRRNLLHGISIVNLGFLAAILWIEFVFFNNPQGGNDQNSRS